MSANPMHLLDLWGKVIRAAAACDFDNIDLATFASFNEPRDVLLYWVSEDNEFTEDVEPEVLKPLEDAIKEFCDARDGARVPTVQGDVLAHLSEISGVLLEEGAPNTASKCEQVRDLVAWNMNAHSGLLGWVNRVVVPTYGSPTKPMPKNLADCLASSTEVLRVMGTATNG